MQHVHLRQNLLFCKRYDLLDDLKNVS